MSANNDAWERLVGKPAAPNSLADRLERHRDAVKRRKRIEYATGREVLPFPDEMSDQEFSLAIAEQLDAEPLAALFAKPSTIPAGADLGDWGSLTPHGRLSPDFLAGPPEPARRRWVGDADGPSPFGESVRVRSLEDA